MPFFIFNALRSEGAYLTAYKLTNKKGLTSSRSKSFRYFWCPLSDSNRPPTDYKSVALPDELKGQRVIFYPISQSLRKVYLLSAFQPHPSPPLWACWPEWH